METPVRIGEFVKDFVRRKAREPRLTGFFLLHASHSSANHFADIRISASRYPAADKFRHLGRY
jgi:hypothetical protein